MELWVWTAKRKASSGALISQGRGPSSSEPRLDKVSHTRAAEEVVEFLGHIIRIKKAPGR